MNRKVITSFLVIGLAVVAIIGGTLAWFTAQSEPIEGDFTAGTVEIEAGQKHGTVVDRTNWNPGDEDECTIEVEVTGTKNVYLRAELEEGWNGTLPAIERHNDFNSFPPNVVDWFLSGEEWPGQVHFMV